MICTVVNAFCVSLTHFIIKRRCYSNSPRHFVVDEEEEKGILAVLWWPHPAPLGGGDEDGPAFSLCLAPCSLILFVLAHPDDSVPPHYSSSRCVCLVGAASYRIPLALTHTLFFQQQQQQLKEKSIDNKHKTTTTIVGRLQSKGGRKGDVLYHYRCILHKC